MLSSFVQYVDTCILGSYGIVSNYFTGIPIIEVFKDYCKHFDIKTAENDFAKYFFRHPVTRPLTPTQRIAAWMNLTELNKYEIAYDDSFHEKYRSLNVPGLCLVKGIHDKSKLKSFDSSRATFSISYIPDLKKDMTTVKGCLDKEKSLLMIAFRGERGGRHISVVGYDVIGFYMIETRPNRSHGAVGVPDICSLPDIGDALLAVPIKSV